MQKYAIIILFSIFIIAMLLSIPIIFAMGIGSAFSYIVIGQDLTAMVRRISYSFKNINQFAIPYFILAGFIMSKGGVSQRIFRFLRACVGHLTGGLANVNVLASMVFAGISGSALADIGGLGYVEIEEMTKAGYDRGFSTAVTLASCTIGPIIPPSIHMIMYAVIAQVSIGKLFIAGIIPGIIIGLILMITIRIMVKNGYTVCPLERKKSLKEIGKEFKNSILSLLAPVIILWGIVSGFTTPAEAGILAILYSLLLSFIYKEFSLKKVVKIFEEAILNFSEIMVLVGIAISMGWVLTYTRVPNNLAELILNISQNPYIILLIINICLIVLGIFINPLAVLLITTPIFVPLIEEVGIDLIHFGVIMSYTTLIGLFTPPAAVGLYVGAKTAGITFEDTFKSFLPFFIPLILAAFIISWIPKLSLWLPSFF